MTEFAKQHRVEGRSVPTTAKPNGISPPKEVYVPAKHNPQENMRPGADDHRKWKSLGDKGGVVYHDRGHK